MLLQNLDADGARRLSYSRGPGARLVVRPVLDVAPRQFADREDMG